MNFVCSRCQVPLTTDVEELRDRSVVSEADGEPLLPAGYFLVCQPDDDIIRLPGEFILNLADMKNTKPHHEPSRLNGCCGLDGCDGMNTLCINGHEVGTEHSDCWMSHYISLPPSCVTKLV